MSVDLDWENLNPSLAESLVDLLNRQLTNITRPSFIGPIEVTSFDFGTTPPDVEVVDLRNVHPDFLEDDGEDPAGSTGRNVIKEDVEDFEWVSRLAMRGKGMREGYLPYSGVTPPPMMDMFSSTPAIHSPWNPAMTNLLDLRDSWPAMSSNNPSHHRTSMYSNHSSSSKVTPPPLPEEIQQHPSSQSQQSAPPPPPHSSHSLPAINRPNLQLHLHITWQSNLRLTLTTSLLINYPSPMFMSLPIKLSVTGLLFNGQLAIAYQGDHHRVHLCILDDLDPYGPSAPPKTPSSTPPENGEEDLSAHTAPPSAGGELGKPPPIGQRLLPNIFIESEIGQADKHILKNVTRVEKFIQDVIRKTVEEELVFPNFHTLVLGDQ